MKPKNESSGQPHTHTHTHIWVNYPFKSPFLILLYMEKRKLVLFTISPFVFYRRKNVMQVCDNVRVYKNYDDFHF